MNTNIISTDHTGVTTIIAHHEKTGARPATLRLSCPVKLLKFARIIPGAEVLDAKGKLIKVGCDIASVVKHTHINAIVNFDYAGNVNRQREREGKAEDFEAQANWFEHVTRAIVAHRKTGERYIFVRVLRNLDTPFFTAGEADESTIERARIVPFLPADDLTDGERAAYGLDPKPANAKQDLDAEITPITFKLANVREIVIDRFTYLVAPDANAITVEPISSTRTASAAHARNADLDAFRERHAAGDPTAIAAGEQ